MRALIVALAALIARCAAAATVPAKDEFSAPPFCPHSAETGLPEEPSPVFFDDIPEFNSSELRARLWRQWESACNFDECSFDKVFKHHREHYKKFDRVVVLDMSGVGPLNGLGNTLSWYMPFLQQSIVLERAAFLRRNLPDCEPHCSFDPSEFFAGYGGIDYRWSNATACAVARAMALRGEKEHVVSLVFNQSATGAVTQIGAINEMTGEYFEGVYDFYTLLSHPSVAPLPWVRFLLPPDPRAGGPGRLIWDMEKILTSRFHDVPTDVRVAAPEMYRAVCLAGRQGADPGSGPQAGTARCGISAFFYPGPRLQRLLSPLLPALDESRRRCGALVGIHVRTGFADMVGSLDSIIHPRRRNGTVPPAEAAPVSAAEAVRNAWRVLKNATRPCPQRCHVGKPPDPTKGYLDDNEAPDCPVGGKPAEREGDVCMDWPNSQFTLWMVQQVQKNHEAHIAAKAAAAGAAPPAGNSSLRFDIGEEEQGPEVGLAPAMLTYAAWVGQDTALKRAVRVPHPSCAAGDDGEDGAAAWLVYVAGDLPLFIATAHASPSLRGHVIDAGRGAGAIGHVAYVGVSPGEEQDEEKLEAKGGGGANTHHHHVDSAAYRKQLGAWSRSVLDLYLLSVCDHLIAAGMSSFTNAATIMHAHGFSWLERTGLDFFNRIRTTGHYIMPREGEVGWGLPLYLSMAEAVERLEAAGLGGSGVT